MNRSLMAGTCGLWKRILPLALLATPLCALPTAWLDFNGQLPGESFDDSHPQWIEIQGFSINGEKPSGKPGSFGLSKFIDRASPGLLSACAKGTRFDRATLDLAYNASQNTSAVPVRLELTGIMVDQVGISREGDAVLERFGLSFESIIYTYQAITDSKVVASYDYVTGKGSTGTPPTNPDSDGDGLPDSWETTYGLSVGSNDSGLDPDGDGMTNLQEFQLGTNPKSGSSFFKAVLTPAAGTPGLYQLSWNSVAGKTYVIEWSPDLKTPFATLRTVTATAATTTESVTNTGTVGFYRVRPQ